MRPLTRLEFLASLLGLGVGTRALARFNPAVVRAKEIPQAEIPRFAAYEFLRLLIERTGIAAEPLEADVCILRAGLCQFGVDAHLADLEMPIDRLVERVIAPAAAAMADVLREQQERGARGLWFTNLAVPRGLDHATRVSDAASGYSARYLARWYYDLEQDESYWVTRFDILYGWRQAPRRRKHPFLTFDPLRLPA
jgi:hypothetical protein